jgi:hypothetical protein
VRISPLAATMRSDELTSTVVVDLTPGELTKALCGMA